MGHFSSIHLEVLCLRTHLLNLGCLDVAIWEKIILTIELKMHGRMVANIYWIGKYKTDFNILHMVVSIKSLATQGAEICQFLKR